MKRGAGQESGFDGARKESQPTSLHRIRKSRIQADRAERERVQKNSSHRGIRTLRADLRAMPRTNQPARRGSKQRRGLAGGWTQNGDIRTQKQNIFYGYPGDLVGVPPSPKIFSWPLCCVSPPFGPPNVTYPAAAVKAHLPTETRLLFHIQELKFLHITIERTIRIYLRANIPVVLQVYHPTISRVFVYVGTGYVEIAVCKCFGTSLTTQKPVYMCSGANPLSMMTLHPTRQGSGTLYPSLEGGGARGIPACLHTRR